MKYIGAIAGLTLAVGACTEAEWRSINRDFNPTHGNSKLIDAKQRALVSVKRPLIGADGEYVRDGKNGIVTAVTFCAEPSPDALQATASALAGAGSLSKEAVQAAFNASFSGSESAASIGLRTQTIQLLRDAYYRLCEAYLNDGLDSIGYDVLQRRVQNQIIALLAVEQLTGAVVASQAALSTSSSADAGAQAGLIANQISATEEQRNGAITEREANMAALDELKKAAEGLPDGAEKTTNDLEQKAVQRRIDANTAEIERLDKLLAQLNTALQEAAQKTSTANSAGVASLTGGSNNSGGAVPAHVTNAVRAITLNAINQDYEKQVCFESLRYRNHTQQYKNDINTVFGPVADQTRIIGSKADDNGVDSRHRVEGGKFLQYCEGVFKAENMRRQAMAALIAERKHQINHIVHAVARDGKIDAADGAIMIQALEQASPLEPGAAFLPRSFEVSRSGDFKSEVRNMVEAELAAAAKKKK